MTLLISVRLDEDLIHTMKANAKASHMSQTDYIRKAIEHMNNAIEKRKRSHRLKQASLRVRKKSIMVNAEFADIEHDPEK